MKNTVIENIQTGGKRKRFLHSLEYEVMANLTRQKFMAEGAPVFENILSIPLQDRIPALMREYGLKRMHKLVKTLLQEFCYAIPLPKSAKLNETRIAVCACDLILAAEEDQLGLEDIIVFFELASSGRYKKFKGMVTHFSIMQKLDLYREERYKAFVSLNEKKHNELKAVGPRERITSEPTPIQDLFGDLRMSG